MTRFKRLYAIAAIILSIFGLLITLNRGGAAEIASAASAYSSPLVDLQQDPNFKAEEYPVGGKEYKIEIIQIAESTRTELLVYTYQPYGRIEASSISISKAINDSYSPRVYSLQLLSSDDVFYKYRVVDFEIEPDALRYYNVATIWRKYDRQIDGNTDVEEKEVAYPVGKLWTASTVQGEVSYTLKQTEVVEIYNPFPGFVRRSKGVSWTNYKSCDVHFIAFNTNYDITRLISADVTYKTQDYKKTLLGGTKESELSERLYERVNHDEKAGNDVNGLFASKYKWDRISRTTDFISDLDIEDEDLKDTLKARTWIINFLETDYTVPLGADNAYAAVFGGVFGTFYNGFELLFGETSGTRVKEVAVLRLEFEVDGKHYNLGAVSNIVSGADRPLDEQGNVVTDWLKDVLEALAKVPWWGWLIIFGVLAIIVIAILSLFFPVAKVILQAILKVLKTVGQFLWKAICFPFKAIKKLSENIAAQRRQRQLYKSLNPPKQTRKKKGKKRGKK